MVMGSLPPAEATQTLLDLANLLGGPDNITATVVEVVEPSQLGQPAPEQLSHSTVLKPRSTRGHVHPLTWAAVALSGIVLVCCALLDYGIPAILGGVGLALSAMFAWMQHIGSGTSGGLLEEIGLRGKAPYRRHKCAPNASRIEPLTDIVRQLEDLEAEGEWEFDLKTIHKDRETAHEAIHRGDFQAALVAYCRAVRGLMEALRQSKMVGPSDSTVDLQNGE